MTNIKKPKKQPLNIQRGWATNTGDKIYIQGKSINNAAPQIEIDSSTTPNLININAQNINIGTSNSTTNVLGTLLNNGNPISGGGTIIQPDWATENNDLLSIHKDNIKLYNPTKSDPTYIEIGTNENSEINIKASKISLNANTHVVVKASNITIGSGSDVNILGTLLNNGQKISNLSNLPIVIGTNNTGTITFSTNQTSMYYKDVCITLGTQTNNYNSNNTGISLRLGSDPTTDARVIEIHPEDISIANNRTTGVIKIDNSGIKIGNGSVSFTTNTGATVPRAIFDLSNKYIDIYNHDNSSSISVFKLDTTIPLNPVYGATIKNNEIRLGTSSTCAFYANYNPSGTSEIKLGSGVATEVWLSDSSASVKINYNSTAHTITFTDPITDYSATIQMTKQ